MSYAFSVDDFDALWHSPMTAPTPDLPFLGGGDPEKMNRSSSEWALERFIQEASASPAASASSAAGGGGGGSPAMGGGDEDVVEIKDPPLPSLPPAAPVDSAEYQAYLKRRLQLACAAVAMSRGTSVKSNNSTLIDEKEQGISNPTKLGSEASGPGNGCSTEQHKADRPIDVPTPALQKKSGGGTTTSESSREHSDDDDLEGDTGTTGNRYPPDDKRARRMQSNRESARRSRRRKQEHVSELEKQVAQLNVENSSLSDRLTDVNQKYKDASVDNRVLRADIETLRAKVKMAEESVKRATGFNPLLQSMHGISGAGAPFLNRPSALSSEPPLFHQPVPSSITGGISQNQRSNNVLPNNLSHPRDGNFPGPKIGQAYPPHSVAGVEPSNKQNSAGPGLPGSMPGVNGRSSRAALDGKK